MIVKLPMHLTDSTHRNPILPKFSINIATKQIKTYLLILSIQERICVC